MRAYILFMPYSLSIKLTMGSAVSSILFVEQLETT
jgi:hypothetical protein